MLVSLLVVENMLVLLMTPSSVLMSMLIVENLFVAQVIASVFAYLLSLLDQFVNRLLSYFSSPVVVDYILMGIITA